MLNKDHKEVFPNTAFFDYESHFNSDILQYDVGKINSSNTFYLLPYYVVSITSSDNKAIHQSYHGKPIVHTSLPDIHLSAPSLFSPLEA